MELKNVGSVAMMRTKGMGSTDLRAEIKGTE